MLSQHLNQTLTSFDRDIIHNRRQLDIHVVHWCGPSWQVLLFHSTVWHLHRDLLKHAFLPVNYLHFFCLCLNKAIWCLLRIEIGLSLLKSLLFKMVSICVRLLVHQVNLELYRWLRLLINRSDPLSQIMRLSDLALQYLYISTAHDTRVINTQLLVSFDFPLFRLQCGVWVPFVPYIWREDDTFVFI